METINENFSCFLEQLITNNSMASSVSTGKFYITHEYWEAVSNSKKLREYLKY